MAVLRSLATVWEGYDGKVNVSYDVMRLKYEYLEADELEILLEEYVRDIIDA